MRLLVTALTLFALAGSAHAQSAEAPTYFTSRERSGSLSPRTAVAVKAITEGGST